MNHTHRLVCKAASQRQRPTPGYAPTRGKPPVKALALLLGALLAPVVWAVQPPAPGTLPTGAQVVAGQASIVQSGNQMSISQGSDKAIINWQSFDIGNQAGVSFTQASRSAVALNRVIASDASQIYGQLKANGQIWLINPNGVIFGAGSKVDAGGLVASTLATTNEDFLAGKAVFTRNGSTGHIVNQGEITAADGGLIALLAPTVQNQGILRAQLGNIALAAGDTITLANGADGRLSVSVSPATLNTLVENKQLIVADGGQIIMTTKAADALTSAVVANNGSLQAQTLAEREGRILLLADTEHGVLKPSSDLALGSDNISATMTASDSSKQEMNVSTPIDTSMLYRQSTPSIGSSEIPPIIFNRASLPTLTVFTAPSSGDLWRSQQAHLLPQPAQRPADNLRAGQQGNGNTGFLTLTPEFIRVATPD